MSTHNSWQDLSWKTRLFMALFNFGLSATRSEGAINRRVSSFLEFRTPPSPKPIDGVETYDVIIDKTRNLWFRVFVPENDDQDKLPVVVFYHGGAFSYLQANSMGCDKLCRRFAKKLNCVIMSVNYRLAPEYKYPSQHEDGFDALKYIDNNEFARANLKHVFLAGDSAGANLAHFVAMKASEYRENFQRVKVIGLLAIQPFFGGEERTDSELKLVNDPMITLQGTDLLWKYFLPDGANRDHPAVNVFGPNGYDISKVEEFPATMVVVGGYDPLRDWQMRYYDGLKKGGKETYLVEYPNAFHAFYGFDELKESGLLIQEAKVFIEKQLGK